MTFKEAWDNNINDKSVPSAMNNIVYYDWQDFRNSINEQTEEFITTTVKSLLDGDVFIIRNVISKEKVELIKQKVFRWAQKTDESFQKMIEGVPDFHRKIDKEISKNYTFRSVWHMHNFFRWNKNDEFFNDIDNSWSILKILSGYEENSFINNTPQNIMIDRLQVCQYPKGGGYIEVHSDPYEIRKTLMCIKMSEKGVDYTEGGLYLLDKNQEKVYVEDNINVGDLYFSFPSVMHGVDKIDSNESEVKWDIIKGRWVILLNTLHSNEVSDKNRAKMGFKR